MKALITGASGYLGSVLVERRPVGADVVGTGHTRTGPDLVSLDIRSHPVVEAAVAAHSPDLVIHCAAMSSVAGSEREQNAARETNVIGAGNVAAAAAGVGARLVALSTDVVYDGENAPYDETSPAQPINVYGRSKLDGEAAVRDAHPEPLILRASAMVGRDRGGRFPFSEFVVQAGEERRAFDAFEDERRNFMPVTTMADHVWELALGTETGLLCVAATASQSRVEFARSLLAALGHDPNLAVAVASPGGGRPRDLTMNVSRAGAVLERPLPSAAAAVAEVVADIEAG